MESVANQVGANFKKSQVVDVRPGDTVKVHQKIREGSKERIQIFQGMVIKTSKKDSQTSRILVRKVASGVGVEKGFLLHSPLVVKIEVTKRSKVRRNYLSYMRERTGKSTRLVGVDFDKGINEVKDDVAEESERLTKEEATKQHAEDAAEKAADQAKEEAKAEEAIAAHDAVKSE